MPASQSVSELNPNSMANAKRKRGGFHFALTRPFGPRSCSSSSPPKKISPAFVGQRRRFGGVGLRPDRDIVFAVLQLDDEAGGQYVLALVVELDALVAHHQLIGLHVGRLERRLDLGGFGGARAIDLVAQDEERLHRSPGGVIHLV